MSARCTTAPIPGSLMESVDIEPFLDAVERFTGERPKRSDNRDAGMLNLFIDIMERVEKVEKRLDALERESA